MYMNNYKMNSLFNKYKILLVILIVINLCINIKPLYFELKDDDERCFYDEYFYLNVIIYNIFIFILRLFQLN